jgi:hypothetical protein
MADQIISLFNFLSEASFDFRRSYQGQVIKWVLIFYLVVVFLDLLLLVKKYPNLWDYAFWGNKKKRSKDQKGTLKVPGSAWDKIKFKLRSVNPNDWKIAVIEADKALDDGLKKAGVPGETIGERLKNITDATLLGELNDIWEAHRTRNSIVHDPLFEIDNFTAENAVVILENASKILEKSTH